MPREQLETESTSPPPPAEPLSLLLPPPGPWPILRGSGAGGQGEPSWERWMLPPPQVWRRLGWRKRPGSGSSVRPAIPSGFAARGQSGFPPELGTLPSLSPSCGFSQQSLIPLQPETGNSSGCSRNWRSGDFRAESLSRHSLRAVSVVSL